MKKICFLFLFCSIAAASFVSCTKSSTSETSYDEKSYVEICGLKWATKNVGAIEDNPYGNLYTYEQARKACPEGWRLPTSNEVWQLSLLHPEIVNHGGMDGVWFSGSTPYKDGVDAVFFPLAGGDWGDGDGKEDVDSSGIYWSSTPHRIDYAYSLCIIGVQDGPVSIGFDYDDRYCEFSVRCVKD